MARVKRIVKADEDVKMITNGAVGLIAKATVRRAKRRGWRARSDRGCAQELFIAYFAEKAYESTVQQKRKTVQYVDAAHAVQSYDALEFLSDVVPERVDVKEQAKKSKAADDGAAAPPKKKSKPAETDKSQSKLSFASTADKAAD